jgi:hypothetical protein
LRLAQERVARPLPRLLALHLGGERGQAEHDFLHRGVEGPLPVLEVEEHPHTGIGNLLQHVARLDRLAAEPGLFRHHQHFERRARSERIQQPGEPRPAGAEKRAADPVVGVDERRIHRPALTLGIDPRVLDLAGDALRLVGEADLLGRLPGVDRGDHGVFVRFVGGFGFRPASFPRRIASARGVSTSGLQE